MKKATPAHKQMLTYEDYKKEFFPESPQEESFFKQDPAVIGATLAGVSLNRLKDALPPGKQIS